MTAMRRTGGSTVSALQRATGLSRSTVRRHLDALGRVGAVTARSNRSGSGRPPQVYSLTVPMALAATGSYPALLEAVFARLQTAAPEQIEAMFPAIARLLAAMHPEVGRIPDTASRLESARQVVFAGMDTSTVMQTDDGLQFSLHECPLASLALEFRELCCAARLVLSDLTGQDVEQSEWIVRGDPRCTFEVRTASKQRQSA
jgi:predicted ArsR family transcriptional regulator